MESNKTHPAILTRYARLTRVAGYNPLKIQLMRYTDHRWMNSPAPSEAEIFEVYYATHQFYQEAHYREDLDSTCQWYRIIAAQNRRELEKMRGDINLFSWFCRKRTR